MLYFRHSSWGEVDGTYTNTDRRVQRVRKAVEAHPNTKDDWEILCDISTIMGYPMSYNNSEEIWDEMQFTCMGNVWWHLLCSTG